MITLRKGPAMACLTLLLSGCALAGLVQTSRADANSAPQKGPTSTCPSAPVVKIDRAMLQEREMLPDGTVHWETFLDAPPAKNALRANRGMTNHAPTGSA